MTNVREPPAVANELVPSSSVDYLEKLKNRYLQFQWPNHRVVQYVRLALILEKEDVTPEDECLDKITKLTLQGEVDIIRKKKEPLHSLEDIFHYQNQPCPRLILIMGGPGIGKTTLINEICLKWARDGFLAEDFDIVVLIQLRSVQNMSLKEAIVEHIGIESYKQMMDSAGSRCLIALEGLDEMAAERRQTDPFLCSLYRRHPLLQEATIIITSRPHACEKLTVSRKIEVVGFGIEEIKEYIEMSLSNDTELVKKFLQQLGDYPHLLSICYVPMSLAMVVEIFTNHTQKILPLTLTELYQQFIVMLLQRELSKDSINQPSSLTATSTVCETPLHGLFAGIPKEAIKMVLLLSKLAYNGIFDNEISVSKIKKKKDPKIIFTTEDLIQCGIKETDQFNGFGLLKYAFTPEMATGTYNFLHFTMQELLCAFHISNLSEQEQLCLMNKCLDEYSNIFLFLCGITRLGSTEMFQLVHSKLTSPDVVTALRCIFESRRKDFSVPTTSPLVLDLSYNYILLPYDCLCISNILSCFPISSLNLMGCYIGNKGAELLVKYYSDESTASQTLEEVYFYSNNLNTDDGLIHVMKIVKINRATLKILDVSNNQIGDSGMLVIAEALKDSSTITMLGLDQCGLSVKSVVYITELLMANCTLEALHIGGNDIGDEGIIIIARVLNKTNISKLYVSKCGISLVGAESLATALLDNKNIKLLMVLGNPLTIKGARLILQSAIVNEICQVILVDKEYESDEEIKEMIATLKDRKKHLENSVEHFWNIDDSTDEKTSASGSDDNYFDCLESQEEAPQQSKIITSAATSRWSYWKCNLI